MRRIAIVGGGWAGLAAAVRATQRGHGVTLYEMARHLGGRARTVEHRGDTFDNGQHILIGAYVRTLALMAAVGVDVEAALARMPLQLLTPDGRGLRLPPGAPISAFLRGAMAHRDWSLSDRAALLGHAAGWALRSFDCDPRLTVDVLCRRMPAALRRDLVDPLCIAALNTSAHQASAQVFLRVLRDALFSGPGSADLLLPRKTLSRLLPAPARRWLVAQGCEVQTGVRVQSLEAAGALWRVNGRPYDAAILACTAPEAARLAAPHAPAWASIAKAFHYEPIVTVVVDAPGARWPAAMVSLPQGPAQFAFDHGALGGPAGRSTWVISGAQAWVDSGQRTIEAAVLAQMSAQFPAGTWPVPPVVRAVWSERRATFKCTPGLRRPGLAIAASLWAAGDFVAGPYPATLEGAVRSGETAAAAAGA